MEGLLGSGRIYKLQVLRNNGRFNHGVGRDRVRVPGNVQYYGLSGSRLLESADNKHRVDARELTSKLVLSTSFYRLVTKLWHGNVFSYVYLFTGTGEGGRGRMPPFIHDALDLTVQTHTLGLPDMEPHCTGIPGHLVGGQD